MIFNMFISVYVLKEGRDTFVTGEWADEKHQIPPTKFSQDVRQMGGRSQCDMYILYIYIIYARAPFNF